MPDTYYSKSFWRFVIIWLLLSSRVTCFPAPTNSWHPLVILFLHKIWISQPQERIPIFNTAARVRWGFYLLFCCLAIFRSLESWLCFLFPFTFSVIVCYSLKMVGWTLVDPREGGPFLSPLLLAHNKSLRNLCWMTEWIFSSLSPSPTNYQRDVDPSRCQKNPVDVKWLQT